MFALRLERVGTLACSVLVCCLVAACDTPGLGSTARDSTAPEPAHTPTTAAAARAIVDDVTTRWPTWPALTAPAWGHATPPTPVLRAPAPAGFVDAPGGRVALDARVVAAGADAGAGTRAHAEFGRTAADGVVVRALPREDAWLNMRPRVPGDSVRHEVDGRIVYRGMVDGVDAVYTVGHDRVEEYLVLRSAADAHRLAFVVELGPGLAGLRTAGAAGAGAGLEAFDALGHAVLRAPPPVGLDARGAVVHGQLLAAQEGAQTWALDVALTSPDVEYPVLLDPSWVGTGTSLAAPGAGGSGTLLTTGQHLLTGDALSGVAEVYDPGTATYQTVGAMVEPRIGHSATLLANGRVLFAGGNVGGTVVASAEIFDPWTRTFTATGSLVHPRQQHAGVLLGDGRVMLIAGYDGGPLDTAEIYDPTTGTFAPLAPLPQALFASTTTLLADGRVLVAGGSTNTEFGVRNAYVYDPATDVWTQTSRMGAPRVGHSATLLPNGGVFVVGGSVVASAGTTELFDPATGAFTPGPNLTTPRGLFDLSLVPNGTVLVSGGLRPRADGVIEVVGTTEQFGVAGLLDGTATPAVEGAPLGTARHLHEVVALPTGRMLASGGVTAEFEPVQAGELYDANAPRFIATGAPAVARLRGAAAPLPDGSVLITGGFDAADPSATPLAHAERFRPGWSDFVPTAPLNFGRMNHSATTLPSGQVLIVGGVQLVGDTVSPVGPAELYDPRSDTFRVVGSMVSPEHPHTATLLADGRVLVVGLSHIEVYDPHTETFARGADLTSLRSQHLSTLLLDQTVLLAPNLGLAERFDPATETVAAVAGVSLDERAFGGSATLLRDGRVLFAGGPRDAAARAQTHVIYDPATQTRTQPALLLGTWTDHAATTLPSGRVVLMGGEHLGPVAEVYDPVTNVAPSTGIALTASRAVPLVTPLRNGAALVTGGTTRTAEILTEQFVLDDATRPVVTDVEGALVPGGTLTIHGVNLVSAAATAENGDAADGRAPIVQLLRLDNEAVYTLPVDDFSAALQRDTPGTLHARIPDDLPVGAFHLTVTTAGVASLGVFVPRVEGDACVADDVCGSGRCVEGVCCGWCDRFIALGAPYAQDFDSLAASGTGSEIPAGWYFNELGTSADTTYGAGSGTATTGNTWSLGAAGSSDRALGTLQSGSLISTIGAAFRNDSSATIAELTLAYVGEQWRMGAAGREDRLDFQVSFDATSLDTGTWIDVDDLDFVAPATDGDVGARDGDLAQNRRSLRAALPLEAASASGLPAGATVWIRWIDVNPSGFDDALAVDDLWVEPVLVPDVAPPPRVTFRHVDTMAVSPAIAGEIVTLNQTLAVAAASPDALEQVTIRVTAGGRLRPVARSLRLMVDGVETRFTDAADFDRGEAGDVVAVRIPTLPAGAVATLAFDAHVLPLAAAGLPVQARATWRSAAGGAPGEATDDRTLAVAQCRVAADCDAGPSCTVGGACVEGVCAARAERVCDDGVACTVDVCDRGLDACVHQPSDARCDDGEPCTRDQCDATSDCVVAPLTGPCDDQNACTSGDVCSAGVCGGAVVICADDANPCTDTVCDATLGCGHANNTSACDDGDPCTLADQCAAGSCGAGTPRDCDDGDPCTDDFCDASGSCASRYRVCAEGSACIDTGGCVSTQCLPCDDTTDCGRSSACVDAASERRCAMGCADDGDCGADERCVEASDGQLRCFGAEGECAAPGVDPDPDPDADAGDDAGDAGDAGAADATPDADSDAGSGDSAVAGAAGCAVRSAPVGAAGPGAVAVALLVVGARRRRGARPSLSP